MITNITSKFLKFKFKQYYNDMNQISVPPYLENREWGFIPFQHFDTSSMIRHLSFNNSNLLKDYILKLVPSHIFYSSAYYKFPSSNNMDLKEWAGADLIFDLDGDHLDHKFENNIEMLENIKKETKKLINFMIEDFGFNDNQIEIVFSGSRGYHIHIYDPKSKIMSNFERREIIDYISGKGLNLKYYFKEVNDNKSKNETKYRLVNYSYGWAKRILEFLTNIISDKEYIFNFINELKIPKNRNFKKLLELLNSNKIEEFIYSGNVNDISIKNFSYIINEIMNRNKNIFVSKFGCNIDEPVTYDIKRLIRFPSSLHGNTGLKVTTIPFNKFESFDPLMDSIVFKSDVLKVNVMKDCLFYLGGKEYNISYGKQVLPEYAAVYLMCKGVANYGHN